MNEIKIKLNNKRNCFKAVIDDKTTEDLIRLLDTTDINDVINLGEIIFLKKDILYIKVKKLKSWRTI